MTREEAETAVQPYVFRVAQYAAVDRGAAVVLLGNERYERLRNDKVRGIGPTSGTIYPWNVVDYLVYPELGVKK